MSRTNLYILGLVLLVLLAAAPLFINSYWVNMLVLAFIAGVGVLSLTVLTGLTGLLSFGQAGFVGLGAYTYGVLTVAKMSVAQATIIGLAVPTLAGLLLGLPAARLKGHYMAIGTLGFGVLISQVLNNSVDITRGPMGLMGITSIGLGRVGWFYLSLAICLLLVAGITYVDRRTFFGLVLKSVKHDELAAGANGVNVFAIKLTAFCISAFLAGLSGVMMAAYMRFLTPDLFLPADSFSLLMMAVVGGVGSATGAFISALCMTAIPELLRSLGQTNLRLLIYGVMVLFVLWFVPTGIGGLIERIRRRGERRIEKLGTRSDGEVPDGDEARVTSR